jgi:hypothetical protein
VSPSINVSFWFQYGDGISTALATTKTELGRLKATMYFLVLTWHG